MNIFIKTFIIIAITTSCVSQQKIYNIDMSGLDYDRTELKLSDIAEIEYIPLRGSNVLRADSTIYLNYAEDRSINISKRDIIIKRRGEGLHAISKKAELDSGIYNFNKRGAFISKSKSDIYKGFLYLDFDVKRRGRIYIKQTNGENYTVLNRKLEPVKSKYRRENVFQENPHFISRNRILSFGHNFNYTISKYNGKVIDKGNIYTNKNSRYFIKSGSYPKPAIRYYSKPITPLAVKANRGYLLISPLTDTVKHINKKGEVRTHIVNKNSRFDNSVNILNSSECSECNSGGFHSMFAETSHMNCEYGATRLWTMWPTMETEEYIFFTSACKVDVVNNLPAKYYVYNKEEDKMYELHSDEIAIPEAALAFDKCYFNHRNLTTAKNKVVEFFSYDYLHNNADNLPKELRERYNSLDKDDSGVLMIVNFK